MQTSLINYSTKGRKNWLTKWTESVPPQDSILSFRQTRIWIQILNLNYLHYRLIGEPYPPLHCSNSTSFTNSNTVNSHVRDVLQRKQQKTWIIDYWQINLMFQCLNMLFPAKLDALPAIETSTQSVQEQQVYKGKCNQQFSFTCRVCAVLRGHSRMKFSSSCLLVQKS